MSINIIPTKIIIPKRSSGIVHRPRLIDYLHEHLERKLLLVTAPAGYGKTTLLIDFASDVGLPVCWYTLDEGDRDPSSFMVYLTASIRQSFPKFGERSIPLSEQGVFSPRAAAAALIADMVNDVPDYFVLILDDWHLVGEAPAIRDLLNELLRYVPEHAHLIVAGRALPRGPLVRLAAQGAVAGLGPDDLRFTAPEVRALLSANYNFEITDDQAVRLTEESEGWITAILLTSQSMGQGLLAGLIHAAGSQDTVYDYLAGEVFERLPAPLGEFLLASAVPRQFTAALCDELRGVSGSQVWIDQIEAQNLFLTHVVAEGETWHRYHHLFREFLLARSRRDDPIAFARLNLCSGELFERRQQVEEAVEHYLAAGAPERAARVMDRTARSLFIAGRTQTLIGWADRLPSELRSIAPELMLYTGQALTDRGRSSEALPVLQLAEAGLRARGDTIGQIRAILLQGWAHYARGKRREALSIGQDVLKRSGNSGIHDPLLEADALRLVGLGYSGMGQWQSAETHLVQALALYRRSESDERRAYNLGRVLHDLAYTLRFMGRLEEAAALQAESLRLWRGIGNPSLLAESLNNAGYDRFLAGDYEGALALYAEAFAQAEEAEDKRSQAYMLEGIAAVQRDRGNFQQAIEIYGKVLPVANDIGDQSLTAWTLDGLGHAHRLARDYDRALALFDQAHRLAEREGINSQVVLSTASIGITQAEQGHLVEGIANLERASNALQAADSRLDLGHVLFWLARAYLENGQAAVAADTLAELARLGGRLGCRPFSLAEARLGMAALVWGAEQLASGNRLQVWLLEVRAAGTEAHIEVVEKHAAPPLIKVYAFGSGRVLCDERLLSTSAWGGSAIARELLFYLLECSPLRKDEIGATFWPDLTLARMTSAFHSAKYKAKRALGTEFVTYEDERYHVDPAADMWYDAAEFKRLLDAARRRPLDDPVALDERRQAVALYTGDYLADIYSDWAVEQRRVLQAQYFEALQQVVAILLRHKQFEQVLELCRRGLEFDFYREELHRGVMRSLANLGHQTEALAHYEAMSRRLMQDLHAPPEPETTNLAEHIRSRRSD